MKHTTLKNMLFSALFLALAFVMPFLTGQIPKFGAMLCPLHVPVLLCGFVCGAPWGLAVGFAAPLLRSLTLGMPPLFPTAVCMAFELAAYGLVTGVLHRLLPRKKAFIYVSLVAAMLVGRLVWGAAMFVCTGIGGTEFTPATFFAGAFADALPGILVQLALIPVLVMVLDRQKEDRA
ncbi:MAG: ECF transporter S component [Clostridia bacterium]|nr:ECF transporter S component [Clostridia bacterium]